MSHSDSLFNSGAGFTCLFVVVILLLILLLILLSCIRQDKETYISRKDKIFMGLLAFGTFCFVELSMLLAWTPVKLNYITGAQGRYFLPFFLFLLPFLFLFLQAYVS